MDNCQSHLKPYNTAYKEKYFDPPSSLNPNYTIKKDIKISGIKLKVSGLS